MNKFSILTQSVILAISVISSAYANAEYDSAHNLPLNHWTGWYAGLDAGLILNKDQLKSQQLGFTNPNGHCDSNSEFTTFSSGIHAGYLHQFHNSWVSGLEANLSLNTHPKDTLSCDCTDSLGTTDRFSFKNRRQFAIKGRVGFALNLDQSQLLPYFTAGGSLVSTRLSYNNEGGDYYSTNATKTGWLLGAGIEWSWWKNWSLRAEYAYVNYGNTNKLKIPSVYGLKDPQGGAHVRLNTNSISIAINYRL